MEALAGNQFSGMEALAGNLYSRLTPDPAKASTPR